MDSENFKTILKGYSVTTVTPFNSDLSMVDIDGLAGNVEFLAKQNVPLIIPNGNTGEFYSLSEHEWLEVLKTVVEGSGERTTVMPGIGNSIKTAIEQMEMAKNLNVPAVMVMYPQHVFSSEEGIFEYYKALLNESKGLSVVLYKRGPLLSDAVLTRLLEYENLVGVKYAFGRIVDFSQTVQKLGHKIIWSCGTAERFAPFYWLAGAEAFTSGLGNFAPKITKQMYTALQTKNYTAAMLVQEQISPLEFLREGHGTVDNVPVVKAAMDYVGLTGGLCRPPIRKLSELERKSVIDVIKDWAI